ncbi:hypothetical protein BCV70DRAFT_202461 [Testicularia cyperi]|uniref:Protein kinase domain-containing protein n=1 Tax=Testicularia cyperi TaxID=1882483 RepID=A0A317XKY9_9BASI|nr:hypothetical protein BCV70DRAFT_202461 [Testicularia cyperi]
MALGGGGGGISGPSSAGAAMGPPAMTPRKPPPPTTPSHKSASAMPFGSGAFGVTPHKTPLRTPGGSKIEQTSSTPIIDFNAIESQKENVQPLAKGRSAHALSNTLNMQHKQRQTLLSTQRAEHEHAVSSAQNDDSDDPLEAWTRYVKWCIDNYPSGQTHESGLIPLLERATRQFKDSEQYTNDPRYLRLWILYARNVECARDVYNFLLANEIGTKLASLYEELAVVLEGQRNYSEADDMYRLGIARRANPLDRIKRRYDEYKTRIILGQQTNTGAAHGTLSNYADALKAAMDAVGRSMLGQKESGSVGPASSHAANSLRGAGLSVGAIGAKGYTGVVNNGRKLNVFHDDDDDGNAAASARSSNNGTSTAGWEDIGTVASRNQENVQADRMGGLQSFKIGASGGVSKKPGSGLAVFKDSDDEDDDAADQNVVAAASATPIAAGVLSPKDAFSKISAGPGLGKKLQSSETDILRKNPFAYWDKDAKLVPTAADLQLAASAPASSKPVASNRKHSGAAAVASSSASSSSSSQSSKHRTKTTVSRSAASNTGASSSTSAPSSTSGKKEIHAAPVDLLYPASFGNPAKKAFYKQRGWHNELILEELYARRRGFSAALEGWEDVQDAVKDPWAYLDEFVGRWLPELADDKEQDQQPDDDPRQHEEDEVAEDVPMPPQQATAAATSLPDLEPTATVIDATTTGFAPSRDVFDPDNSVANAVALNLRPNPKKKKRRGDATGKMSPTLITKATLLEVENMFNGQDSSDEDEDDESSEDDDDDDEDHDLVAPLPSVGRVGPQLMRISLGSAADVPPTPTPLSRNTKSTATAGGASVINDENAGVRATPSRTPGGLRTGLGGATPMRTPLGQKLSMLANKPVFREEDEDEDDQRPLPPVSSNAESAFQADAQRAEQVVPAPAAVPATPMPTRQPASRRWIEPMIEEDEDEDEEEEEDDNGNDHHRHEAFEHEHGRACDDGQDEQQHPQSGQFEYNENLFRPQFQPLTPITEATFEFTRYTNARTPGTATRSINSRFKSWQHSNDDDDEGEEEEEEGDADQDAPCKPILPSEADGDEEEESRSDERSDASDSATGEANRSQGWTDANKADFELTKGLTISRRHDDDTEVDEEEGEHEDEHERETSIDEAQDARGEDKHGEESELESHERFSRSLVIHDEAAAAMTTTDASGSQAAVLAIPNPCSPVDASVLATLLASLAVPLSCSSKYVDLGGQSSRGKLAVLQKKCKTSLAANQVTRKSMGGTLFHGTGMLASPFAVEIGEGETYEIRGKLGEGGYGAVFLGYDVESSATGRGASNPGKHGQDAGSDSDDASDDDSDDDDDDEEEADRRKMVALKVESPPNKWEFYILQQLEARLERELHASVICARRFYAYDDESFLVLDLGEKGTLLEVVNNAVSAGVASPMVGLGSGSGSGSGGGSSSNNRDVEGGAGLEEVLAMFFVCELIRVVVAMHRAGVVHGDLKIDNCLLRLDDVRPGTAWSNIYSASGENGWSSKGITLIDFGRAIDLSLFPSPSPSPSPSTSTTTKRRQKFVADWETDARDCREMREGRPWTFEPDWFGIAAIAHCLLFGRYIDTRPADGTAGGASARVRTRISAPMKRYWQQELWSSLFDVCLNPPSLSISPPNNNNNNNNHNHNDEKENEVEVDVEATLATLSTCLDRMQSWLELHSNKGGKNLKGLLRKLEIWAMKQGH